jgi:hypothetical protein
MKTTRYLAGTLTLTMVVVLVSGSGPLRAAPQSATPDPLAGAAAGSGICDRLAVGVPYESIGTVMGAGLVQVLPGSKPDGLYAGADNQYWAEDHPELLDISEENDWFGVSLVGGGFDGNGYADLAIGVSGEDVLASTGLEYNAGAVHILYSWSPAGLSAAGDQVFHQEVGTIHSVAETSDFFGSELASGDFDGDGYADLAVGVPDESWNLTKSGVVQVIYGSEGGLTDTGNQLWRQGADGLQGTEGSEHEFGSALAVGDFDGDHYDDLVVGAPRDSTEEVYAGAVHILYGSAGGLTALDDQVWYQGVAGLEGIAEQTDRFGSALAAANFDGDGFDDLAVGVMGQGVWSDSAGQLMYGAGAVHVLYGSNSGLSAAGDEIWSQESGAIHSVAETGDQFGSILEAGDFNGDGHADLAVGVPNEDWFQSESGVVQIIYGSGSGLTDAGNQLWRQGADGLPETEAEDDYFGHALAAGDYDRDGYADLAVGVAYEDLEEPEPDVENAGVVHVLYGSGGGLTAAGNQLWYEGAAGLEGIAEEDDRFGYAMAAIRIPLRQTYLPLILRNSGNP